jgi:antitoxin component YwqK of YwqJK toxin-antitoxin module
MFQQIKFHFIILFLGITFVLTIIGCAQKKTVRYEVVDGDSVLIKFSPDGKIRESVSVIRNGYQNGLYKSYYPNGMIRETGHMKDDKRDGLWFFYNTDSTLLNAYHYSNDSIIKILDKSDFDFSEIIIPNNRLRINIPSAWAKNVVDQGEVLFTARKECGLGKFCPNIVITIYRPEQKYSFSAFTKQYLEFLRTAYPNVGVIYERSLIIDNKSAYQWALTFRQENVNLGAINTLVNAANGILIISEMAPNESTGDFLKYKGLFEQIAATLRSF